MTDNEQRAHDLALAAVQAIFNKESGTMLNEDLKLLQQSGDENVFNLYQNFYDAFLARLNDQQP